ncbi:MAG: PBSX family phage terminase large subunit [Phycisphaerae bacterium]|nr:PBSX family phage terminase large subunit [Phycisphaerae bacterium]
MEELNLNKKYLVFKESFARYFIVTGGRGSGKSFAVNSILLLLTYQAGHTILFTRFTLRAASISIIPEFIEKLEILNLIDKFKITKDEIINKGNGSKIIFRGIKTSSGDQTANLKSLQGITTWVMDEAEELNDEDIFDKIDLSVRNKVQENRVILILNPTTKEHFIYKRWFEDRGVAAGSNITKEDTTYIHTTYLDNIDNLSESYIKQIETMKVRRPNRYKHTIEGAWLDKAEGVIFTDWSIGEFQQVGKVVFGQDYGFSNDPSTLVKTSIDKENKVIYIQLCFYQTKLTTSEILQLNKKFAADNLIVGDSAEPRLITELSRDCNVVPAIKGQGSITFGISLLQDYDLVITEDSTDLIKEFNNYCWLEKKSQTPVDNFNHAIDALRYAVSYQLQNPSLGEYHIY